MEIQSNQYNPMPCELVENIEEALPYSFYFSKTREMVKALATSSEKDCSMLQAEDRRRAKEIWSLNLLDHEFDFHRAWYKL